MAGMFNIFSRGTKHTGSKKQRNHSKDKAKRKMSHESRRKNR